MQRQLLGSGEMITPHSDAVRQTVELRDRSSTTTLRRARCNKVHIRV